MIYNTAGTRTVRLRVTDAGGVSDTTTASVSVTLANTPPQPAFVITPTSPDVGDQVSVNAATTTDDKTLTAGSYAWDLDGDGQYDDATGTTATTSFRRREPRRSGSGSRTPTAWPWRSRTA